MMRSEYIGRSFSDSTSPPELDWSAADLFEKGNSANTLAADMVQKDKSFWPETWN